MRDPEELLDILLDLPQLYQAELSPKGGWLVWVWNGVDEVPNLWARPVGGERRRLTQGPTKNFFVSFLPHERGVVFEADPGDERAGLYARPFDGELRPLTEPHPPYFVRGGDLHPERPWLFFGANYDFIRKETIEPTWIWRKDLVTGEHFPLARPPKPGSGWPELSPDGRYLLYFRADFHPAGRQVWLVDAEGSEDREFLNAGPESKVWATWTRTGQVAFLAEAEGYRRLGIKAPSGKTRTLVDDPALNLEHLSRLAATEFMQALVVEDARNYPLVIDVPSGRQFSVRPPYGNLSLLGRTDEGWVGVFSSSVHPADIVLLDLGQPDPETFQSLTGLGDFTPLRPSELVPAEPFEWRSTDGLRVHGFVYRSPRRSKGTIVLIHGGPTAHASERVNPEVQYYLARGFNVFLPNYRGSTGYGLSFQEKIKETGWGGMEQEDIRTGIEALIEAGIAEPYKVGVTGTSYGGYSSWWQITHAPRALVAAAAPICGMTDLVVDYYTTRPDLRPYSEEMLGGSPEEVPERYRERSPIHYVDRIEGKLLIVQGALDPNVTPENVAAVRERLEAHGIPYELLIFEDEGHGIVKKENRRVLYKRLADFFEIAFDR